MNNFKVLMNGIVKENPTFVLLLGMCPTLGTTSSAINGMGMGLATMFVLICSNVVISLIKNLIPDMVRIPSFIVVIASFVTLLQMVMQAYVPGLYATLGLFIPLIVVNCIVLGRAEAFAAKNNALSLCSTESVWDWALQLPLHCWELFVSSWVQARYSTCQSFRKNTVCLSLCLLRVRLSHWDI